MNRVTLPLISASTFAYEIDTTIMEYNKYVGMWVTGDGYIRQELLPGGRYDEARGTKKSAYTGRYKITGDYIYYRDDSGFTADGTFKDENKLYHGGYIFNREMMNKEQK